MSKLSTFELYSDRIKWSNDTEAANISLSYPIFFPKGGVFISRKKKIDQILIPDEILRLFFDDNSLSIIKDKDGDRNRIVVTFYFSTFKNNIHLIFYEKEKEMVISNSNKQATLRLEYPIRRVQGRLTYILPFDLVMAHCRYYKIQYDLRHKKIILTDWLNRFQFSKSMFPRMFPI
jgi:hypothetical protein